MCLGALLNQHPQFHWSGTFVFITSYLWLFSYVCYTNSARLPLIIGDNHLMDLHYDVWPPMPHYDIWEQKSHVSENSQTAANSTSPIYIKSGRELFQRKSKVIRILPLPVDGDCLSNDGRRSGVCLNAYQCHSKGGSARGNCAMGFGVCCIFVAKCNVTISNNVTYIVSPNFPSFVGNPFYACWLKVRLMNDDISQLRLDFYHFTLGQPNRRTGVCDGDSFTISGGLNGKFTLCGQNSGQHVYYNVGGRALPRQSLYGSLRPIRYDELYGDGMRNASSSFNESSKEIEINMKFTSRFLPSRLWEIRIAQIPFSQRAPAGCLQYFTGIEGIFQTFNFADNGRHLANQNYRICMRQEMDMCSIVYQPCDAESFRVGPNYASSNRSPINLTSSTSMLSMLGIPPNSLLSGISLSPPATQLINSMMSSMGISSVPMVSSPNYGGGSLQNDSVMTTTTGISSVNLNNMNMSTESTSSSSMPNNDGIGEGGAPTISPTVSTAAASSSMMVGSSTSVTEADDPGGDTSSIQTTTASTTTSISSTTRTTTTKTTTASTTSTTTTTITVPPPTSPTASLGPPSMMPPPTTATTVAVPTMRPLVSTIMTSPSTLITIRSSTVHSSTTLLSNDVEGSGEEDFPDNGVPIATTRRPPFRRPRPIFGGGFDLFGLLSNALDLGRRKDRSHPLNVRKGRQFFTNCRDRITMPCIVEDFIDSGWGPLPGCEPVHCGTQFCSTGVWPCRIESTVTPFYVGIHFGDGKGKGSAEENIGACLRYSQIQCL